MFLTSLMTTLVRSMEAVFDADHPEEDFRNLHVSLEYPAEEQHYPGIWVDFDLTQPLETAGIDHREYIEVDDGGGGTVTKAVQRWRFSGVAEYTLVTLSSLERARLWDEVVQAFAFAATDPSRAGYRAFFESNPYVGVSGQFDRFAAGRFATSPGTPWNSDDYIYEATITLEIIGEFVSDPDDATALVMLEAIDVHEFPDTPEGVAASLALQTDGQGNWS